ncbi:GRAM domain-containing protein 4 isoform X2, partial [Biomphalaria pfeifferi]
MSSFRNLRQRFNKDRDDQQKVISKSGQEHGTLIEEEVFEVIEDGETRQRTEKEQQCQLCDETQSCGSLPTEELLSTVSWSSPEEKKIFEEQLNLLQEQLMIVMIENQTLKSELNANGNRREIEKLKCELTCEQQKCEALKKKLEQVMKQKRAHVSQNLSSKNKNLVDAQIAGPSQTVTQDQNQTKRFYEVVFEYLLSVCYNFLDDFTEEVEETRTKDSEGDPLAVKTLKENVKRFGTEAKPYLNTLKGIYDLKAWKAAPYTLIVFVFFTPAAVYMYSVWQGWFLPVLLFCFTLRLFINYLKYRGWNIHFNFFETVEETKDADDKDLSVSDKLNIVMQVARNVQNILGEVADCLEKIKSLLTWRHPQASQKLLSMTFVAFITSCLLPTNYLFFYAGLGLGIKFFIIDYIYNRFPRVRRKYDSTYQLWAELPTDLEFEKKFIKSEIDKYILPHDEDKEEIIETKSEQVSIDDKTFCELFSLPETECPLQGWHGGKRCILINKDKSLTAAFKNGRLYLTHSFLCFERTKVPSVKNIVIPLTDILKLEKAKPFSWMPGGGMAIEIGVAGNDK